ncbi:MAG: c-type cytochrome [Bryobacterales bacterium]|nr:c-type cytochrome [Bryobacterales bacterium]
MARSTSYFLVISAAVLLPSACILAQGPQGNAGRGEKLFNELRCSTCHSVRGAGGASAPALGPKAGQTYTPNTLAGSMWSHVTKMWEAMKTAGISRPKITEQQAADLFVYFGGAAGSDKPGNAAQGRKVFEAKLCASCHDDSYQAPDLTRLAGNVSAYSMVQSLWEHGEGMLARMVSRNTAWQTMTAAEMGHIIAYLNSKK